MSSWSSYQDVTAVTNISSNVTAILSRQSIMASQHAHWGSVYRLLSVTRSQTWSPLLLLPLSSKHSLPHDDPTQPHDGPPPPSMVAPISPARPTFCPHSAGASLLLWPWPYSRVPPCLPPSVILPPLVHSSCWLLLRTTRQTHRPSPDFLATCPIAELWEVVRVTEREGTSWGWEWEPKPGRSRGKRYKRGMESSGDGGLG